MLRSGSVATNSDCCCTPPCWPDPCIIPNCDKCNKCWNTTCLQCLTLQDIEVSITGVGNSMECPPQFDIGDCCYNFDGCKCNEFNSTFIHDFTTKGCSSAWDLDVNNYPFNYDTCNTPQTFQCYGLQIDKSISIKVAVASKSVSYTSGGLKNIEIPCYGTEYGYVCNNYTIPPGHFVIVRLESFISTFGVPLYGDCKIFIYSFNNGVKADPDCAEDQYYPTCNWTGGTAILLLSQKTSVNNQFQTVYHAECTSWNWNCQLADAVITVEAPTTTLCEETEEPPPP